VIDRPSPWGTPRAPVVLSKTLVVSDESRIDRPPRPLAASLPQLVISTPVAERSVLRIIQQLEETDRERRVQAANNVVASARVASEFFSDFGLRVLAEYFNDGMIGSHALEAVRLILQHRPDHPLADEIVSAALAAPKRNWFLDDEVSLLIVDRAERAGICRSVARADNGLL
jgi:hypothetical protein